MNITSITDLIKLLDQIKAPPKGYTRFFRGHSNFKWEIEPSIYRKDNSKNTLLIKNEDKIIRDVIINSPDDFSDKDSLFSILVKLQHYGYPTRLLDLTTNALVALYFSATKQDNNDGELIVFDIPNDEIKYFDSDTVSILSALSLRNCDFNINGFKLFSKITSLFKKLEMIQKYRAEANVVPISEILFSLTSSISFKNENTLHFSESEILKIENMISVLLKEEKISGLYLKAIAEEEQKAYIETFNSQPEISRLLHDIRKDKPSFLPKIIPQDLEKVICVKPKMNNKRIIRQQGAFLLFGINASKKNKAKLNEDWIRKDIEGEKIIITKEHKQDILNELKIFGISKKTLFPELESQAEEILSIYK
ncbi:FRG domain-containing protein [Pasteurella multocida]|uniref:FRG domain-containing protein n=1 Tax=Pasteurella multocida TaxID=747 RepID=UPI002872F7E9|nr:FRG domain-containing protein [Pasteurella multocida]